MGQVVNTSVVKMSENGRTVTLSVDPTVIRAASVGFLALYYLTSHLRDHDQGLPNDL